MCLHFTVAGYATYVAICDKTDEVHCTPNYNIHSWTVRHAIKVSTWPEVLYSTKFLE